MKILFLLPAVPVPADSGAKMRNLLLLEAAAQRHQVDVLAFGERDDMQRLASLVRDADVVAPPRPRSLLARSADLLSSPLPDLVLRLRSDEFRRRLASRVEQYAYDVVQVEGVEMASYLDAVPRGAARVYDAHNAEYLLQRRAAQLAGERAHPAQLPSAAYSLIQWRRLERYERRLVVSCQVTIAVSHHDANLLEALAPNGPVVEVVPNGVDTAHYSFRTPESGAAQNLLFVGKLDFRPNADAVAWLLDHVMPLVHSTHPEARLLCVGRNPPGWLVRRGQLDNRIAVIGGVEDERPYLARAAACLLPLHFGGGSRLKALVAFASGLPVIGTRLAMEGLEVEAGVDHLRAERPDEWANAIGQLLDTPSLRLDLAVKARAVVEQFYDQAAIAPRLLAVYDRLAARNG